SAGRRLVSGCSAGGHTPPLQFGCKIHDSTRRRWFMRQLFLASVAMLIVATSAGAQQPAAPVCPPGGYAPPIYGVFGVNGGGGQVAYEIASPCIPKEVRDAAE